MKMKNSAIKPFDSIPGPNSLPLIGTLWMYLPVFGRYKFHRLHWNGFFNFHKYGPLVREDIVPSIRMVWIFKPEDIETLYRCEGRYPERRSHLALKKYRLDRPHLYNNGGLLPTNGPEWVRLRKIFQQDLSKTHIRSYLSQSDAIIKTFLDYCENKKNCDLLPYISRMFLELIVKIIFDESLDCFSEIELRRDSRSSRLIDAAATINSLILQTDNGLQLWRHFDTPAYRKLCEAHMYIETITKYFVDKKISVMKTTNRPASSLLEVYLRDRNLNLKDIFGMMVDLLLAGIDTMAYTSSFALYHIANNSDKQNKIFQELKKMMSSHSPVTEEILDECIYTKAAIKEIFRLNPVSVGVGRILVEDAIFSNYHVPKGTIAVTQNQVSCRLAEYFPNPNDFIPERWLRETSNEKIHPYLVLPFGHGPRTCIARRLAEQNLQLLIINAVRKYKLFWLGQDLDCQSIQINKPDKKILIHLQKRSS